MPNTGMSNPTFFNMGFDISSNDIKRNFMTINVKYRGSKVANPANSFDLILCIIEFIDIKIKF